MSPKGWQDYFDAALRGFSDDCARREMTAGDLGLNAYDAIWLERSVSDWARLRKSDAPYSFWLGADHG